jgi:hypothetical protein
MASALRDVDRDVEFALGLGLLLRGVLDQGR